MLAGIHAPESLGALERFIRNRLAVVFSAFELLDGFLFDVDVGHDMGC